jgi:hypothetical protein
MATQNSINKYTEKLTIDPGSSGDSFVQFAYNAVEFRMGVDDSDFDSFKISQGSALGTNDTFVVSSTGEVNKPLTPCFLAIASSTIDNVTGDGTDYVIAWGQEPFDQGGDFSSTTFTAPVTGKYFLQYQVTYTGLTSAHVAGLTRLKTSNAEYRPSYLNYYVMSDGNTRAGVNGCVIADMDASDTAYIECTVTSGTKVVDIYSNGTTDPYSWFSGSLLY